MRIPQDENKVVRTWTLAPANDALLYFAQLMRELVSHQSPDFLRAVTLDSYHRTQELERSWNESHAAGIAVDLSAQIEELTYYLRRDPIITRNNVEVWEAVQPRLNSARDRPSDAIEAVRILVGKLKNTYLRHCRDYIEEHVSNGKSKDKRQFRFVVENYCAHLFNLGYRSQVISYRVRVHFFERELAASATRELQDFFAFFSKKAISPHTVGFAVTHDFDEILASRQEFSKVGRGVGQPIQVRPTTFSTQPQQYVYSWTTPALDAVDARAQGEAHLTKLRSVAYTVMPYAKLDWDPHVVVVEADGNSIVLRETLDVMRQGRWINRGRLQEMEARVKFFHADRPAIDDRNRLSNVITTYASAFHTESQASQLLSLWSSLEGILPAPTDRSSRIGSFARDVRACYTRLYFAKRLTALDFDLYGVYGDIYAENLKDVTSIKQDPTSRLASLMCLASNASNQSTIGAMCATNPLARQRLFELHDSGKSPKDLYRLAFDAGRKVEWQLQRIYRERNRIVHRARPSETLEGLIQILNAYTLIVFETLVRIDANNPLERTVDDIFAEVRIMEDARQRRVAGIADKPMDPEGLEVVLGPER